MGQPLNVFQCTPGAVPLQRTPSRDCDTAFPQPAAAPTPGAVPLQLNPPPDNVRGPVPSIQAPVPSSLGPRALHPGVEPYIRAAVPFPGG